MDITATIGQTRLRGSWLCLGVAAALALLPSQLDAQQVQFQPHAGLSLPTRVSIQNGSLHIRQKIGLVAGARVIVTFSERFDVITGFSYTPGYATVIGAGKRIALSTSPQVLGGSAGARYWLKPPTRPFSWQVNTTVGVVFGGIAAYEELFESSTLSATLGTLLRYQIGRIVSLQLKIQERLYRVRLGVPHPEKSSSPLQVSFGIGLPFLELARPIPHPTDGTFQ